MAARSLIFAVVVFCACGAPNASPDGSPLVIPTSDGGIPANRDDVVAFLRSGQYLGWKSEPAAHRSTGPHGGLVRTFVNGALFDSLSAGSASHPPGSITVKELFDGTTRTGWALDAKLDDGSWLWFEGFEPALNQYFFRGSGNLCANCHAGGSDTVLTPASAFR